MMNLHIRAPHAIDQHLSNLNNNEPGLSYQVETATSHDRSTTAQRVCDALRDHHDGGRGGSTIRGTPMRAR
jgi:hypothetical protein